MVIKFLVANFTPGSDVKSEHMPATDLLFTEKGIVISFPQRDLHFKSNEIILSGQESIHDEKEKV